MISKKKISVLAIILIFIGIVGGLLTANKTHKYVSVNEIKEVSNQNFTSMNIQIDNARVKVIPTKEATSKVVLKGKRSTSYDPNLSVKIDGKTLAIKLAERQVKWFNFDFVLTRLTLYVYVPEKLYDSVKVACDNGQIEMANIDTKSIYAKTNNGQIDLKNIPAKSVAVFSDNGKISLTNVDGKVTGRTNNGRISLVTNSIDRPIQFACDNGSILIQTDKNPKNVRFETSVDNGSVNILDKYTGGAVIGKGDNLIKLSTNNGKISVIKQ